MKKVSQLWNQTRNHRRNRRTKRNDRGHKTGNDIPYFILLWTHTHTENTVGHFRKDSIFIYLFFFLSGFCVGIGEEFFHLEFAICSIAVRPPFFFYLVHKYAAQVNKSRVFLFFSVFYFVFIFVAICFGFFFWFFFFLFGVFELEMVPISVSRSRSAVFTCHRPPKIDLSEVLLGFTGFYRVLPGFHWFPLFNKEVGTGLVWLY